MSGKSPFDFVESVTYTKKDLIEEGRPEKDYNPWLVNKALSYHPDTILYANECNLYHGLDLKLQYDYLRHSVRQSRRRAKWHRSEEDTETLDLISWWYKVSRDKAREILPLIDSRHVSEIKSIQESTTQ